jgi:hypothetical protein
MDVKLGLIADYANISQDGKLNVMGIFSRIVAQSFPVTHPVMHIVLVFHAGAAEKKSKKEFQVRMLNEDGKSIVEINGNLVVPDQPGPFVEIQQIFALQLLQLQSAGTYEFHVLVNGETKTTIPLMVQQQTPPPDRPTGLA